MAFVRTETWTAVENSHALTKLWKDLLEHSWLERTVACLLSLLISGLMLDVIFLIGIVAPPSHLMAKQPAITVIDVPSPTSQREGAALKPLSPQHVAPLTIQLALTHPAALKEWKIVSLPSEPVADLPTAEPATSATPATGLSDAGHGSGAGYDPYAFASYRAPSSGTGATPIVTSNTDPARMLSAMLHERLGTLGLQVQVRVTVDTAGRIIQANIVSGASKVTSTAIIAALTGQQLYDGRSSQVASGSMTVSIAI